MNQNVVDALSKVIESYKNMDIAELAGVSKSENEYFITGLEVAKNIVQDEQSYAVSLEFNKDLMWLSDWDGHEVGHPNVLTIGLYKLKDSEVYFYIDYSNNKIVEAWGERSED